MSYCARFHTTSSTEPICEAGLVYFSSFAESELMIRFWVPPFKFVDDAASMLVVRVFVCSQSLYRRCALLGGDLVQVVGSELRNVGPKNHE